MLQLVIHQSQEQKVGTGQGDDRTLEIHRVAFGWDERENSSSSETGSCKREGNVNFFLHLISLGISEAEKVLCPVPEFCERQRRRVVNAGQMTRGSGTEEGIREKRELETGDFDSRRCLQCRRFVICLNVSCVRPCLSMYILVCVYLCVYVCVCICACMLPRKLPHKCSLHSSVQLSNEWAFHLVWLGGQLGWMGVWPNGRMGVAASCALERKIQQKNITATDNFPLIY